jgi:hypothetical protein
MQNFAPVISKTCTLEAKTIRETLDNDFHTSEYKKQTLIKGPIKYNPKTKLFAIK